MRKPKRPRRREPNPPRLGLLSGQETEGMDPREATSNKRNGGSFNTGTV